MSCFMSFIGKVLTFMASQLREDPGTSTRTGGEAITEGEGILPTPRPTS